MVLRATSGLGGTVDGGTVDGGTLVGVWGCSRWVWVKIGWGGGLGGQMGSCVGVKGGGEDTGQPLPIPVGLTPPCTPRHRRGGSL